MGAFERAADGDDRRCRCLQGGAGARHRKKLLEVFAWDLAYGKDRAFYESLGPDHKVNRSKPDIAEESLGWYEAFYQLSSSRAEGFAGALPVAISEIDAYCRLTETPALERPSFLRMLRRLDVGFLDLAKKQKTKTLPQSNESL